MLGGEGGVVRVSRKGSCMFARHELLGLKKMYRGLGMCVNIVTRVCERQIFG